ncbi:hypothetical protein FACS1894211_01570 [Clostridia bacterium]|nr:hypothetical protein FACS1894211_01570 [Clostridia bacterium]
MKKWKGFAAFALTILFVLPYLTACRPGDGAPEGQPPPPSPAAVVSPLPEGYRGKDFIYDEILYDAGARLYTLSFSDDGYKLYGDDGLGVVASGGAYLSDGVLTFGDGAAEIKAAGASEAEITARFAGKAMTFTPATATAEYVYTSYLGVFNAQMGRKDAVLILERFFEFFLYSEGTLITGVYEIYGSSIELSANDGTRLSGTVYKGVFGGAFYLPATRISLTAFGGAGEFAWYAAPATKTYIAPHGMGDYTLTVQKADVFVIYGPDGLIKAVGTLEKDAQTGTGSAVYFPRYFLSNAERTVEFTFDDTGYVFPGTTPLLPGSGNIDAETGMGTYFTAGQPLYFSQSAAQDEIEPDTTVYGVTGTVKADDAPLSGVKVFINGELKAETDAAGAFSVAALTGSLQLHFEKEGYLFGFYTVTKDSVSVAENGKALSAPLSQHIPDSSGLRQVMPSIGVAKPLALLIDFPDYNRPRFVTAAAVKAELFSIGNERSLSSYYYRSSYGKLRIEGDVLDWYRAAKPRADYANDKAIMTEALNSFIAKGLNLADYDADGDKVVDSLFVLWAGALQMGSNTWGGAYRSTWNGSPWTTKVTGYIFVPGQTVWKAVAPVICNTLSLRHEVGHLLGLNDYYSYDTEDKRRNGYAFTGGASEGGLGTMDMMDSNLGDHNAFSKWLLGWLDPKIVEYGDRANLDYATDVYSLRPISENGDALFVKLKQSDDLFTELFVIETVAPTLNGTSLGRLSGPVVRILHVDATPQRADESGNWRGYGFRNDNSYTSVKFISVVEADGLDRVLNFHSRFQNDKPNYDENLYFKAGDELTPFSYPNTNAYDVDGNATVPTGLKIGIDGFSAAGTATVKLGYDAADTSGELVITGVSPERYVSPAPSFAYINLETQEFTFTFNTPIAFADAGAGSRIQLWSNGGEITAGWTAEISGADLKLVFSAQLEANRDYEVIVPRGTAARADDPDRINNFNYTAGFVTKGGIDKPLAALAFPQTALTIYGAGAKYDVSALLVKTPSDTTEPDIVYSSSDPSVAEIDPQTGAVVAKAVGTTTVTATSAAHAGITATLTLTVDNKADEPSAGLYNAAVPTGAGALEFTLELREDGTYRYRMLPHPMMNPAGSLLGSGTYTVSGNTLTFVSGNNVPATAAISRDGNDVWSVVGSFNIGTGSTPLTFTK